MWKEREEKGVREEGRGGIYRGKMKECEGREKGTKAYMSLVKLASVTASSSSKQQSQ